MQCITPFTVYKKTGNVTMGTKVTKSVSCGKCVPCRKKRASAWSFRLVQEEKRCLSSNFITLTYATDHAQYSQNGWLNLDKSDLQNFIKRLRKLQSHQTPIKYYACGEYGGKTNRPHYHVILFNAELETIQSAWSLENRKIGEVHYGDVNVRSINYSLKYISKPSRVGELGETDDRQIEFALMSKGIGDNYLTEAMVKWHHAEPYKRMYCNLTDGKKISMPRYYKERIYEKDHRTAIGVKERQRIVQEEAKTYKKNPKRYVELFEAHKALIRNDIIQRNKNEKL